MQKKTCVFFEAGIGTGKLLKTIVDLNGGEGGVIYAIGCDVFIDPDFIDSGFKVYEGTLYETLQKLDDNSIDVFY
jgi:hypothetical protein